MDKFISDMKKAVALLDFRDPRHSEVWTDFRKSVSSITDIEDSMTIDEVIETLERNLRELSRALDHVRRVIGDGGERDNHARNRPSKPVENH